MICECVQIPWEWRVSECLVSSFKRIIAHVIIISQLKNYASETFGRKKKKNNEQIFEDTTTYSRWNRIIHATLVYFQWIFPCPPKTNGTKCNFCSINHISAFSTAINSIFSFCNSYSLQFNRVEKKHVHKWNEKHQAERCII